MAEVKVVFGAISDQSLASPPIGGVIISWEVFPLVAFPVLVGAEGAALLRPAR